MEITRNNYEAFFLDYLEGNLDESLVNEFIEFLKQNPDLKQELDNFSTIPLNPSEVQFTNKNKLYKEKYDSDFTFNNASIGFLENDLTDIDKCEFEDYLKTHPEKQKDFQLFQKTKLVADDSIVFKKKSVLRKTSTTRKIWLAAIRVAAIIILVFAISVLIRQSAKIETPPSQIVQVEENLTFQEPEAPEKNQAIPIANVTLKTEPTLTIPENSMVKTEDESLAVIRRDFVIPKTIGMKNIQLASVQPETVLAGFDLIPNSLNNDQLFAEKNMLIGERIKNAAGVNKFRLNDITKAGLKLFSNISNNKFTYDTNEQGDITELSLDTRLLAFSIPTKVNPE